MIYVALAQTVVILLLVWMLRQERGAAAKLLADWAKEWREERTELVRAIKSPNYLPRSGEEKSPEPSRKVRDLEAYGAIGRIGVARPPEPEVTEANG